MGEGANRNAKTPAGTKQPDKKKEADGAKLPMVSASAWDQLQMAQDRQSSGRFDSEARWARDGLEFSTDDDETMSAPTSGEIGGTLSSSTFKAVSEARVIVAAAASTTQAATALAFAPGVAPTASGNLASTPIVHLLVYVLDHELTGSMVFREPSGLQHCVYFESGLACKVRLGRPVALLGDELVAAGGITPETVSAVVQAAHENSCLLGDYLVRAGFVSSEVLDRTLVTQATHKLQHVVNLDPATTYSYYRDVNLLWAWAGPYGVPAEPMNTILACARVWRELDRMRSAILGLKRQVVKLHPQVDLSALVLTRDERGLLSRMMQGPCSIAELFDGSVADPRVATYFTYMLMATRQLAIEGVREPLRPRLGTLPSSRPAAKPDAVSYSFNSLTSIPPPIERKKIPSFDDIEEVSSADLESLDDPMPPTLDDVELEDLGPADIPDLPPVRQSPPSLARSSELPDLTPLPGPLPRPSSAPPPATTTPSVPFALRPRSEAPKAQSEWERVAGAPSAKGSLSTTPVAHLLVYMFDHAANGTAVLKEPDGVEHVIYFSAGAPSKVKTGRQVALLGEVLLHGGKISPVQLDGAVTPAQNQLQLLGAYLVAQGLVSEADVNDALKRQVIDKIVGLVNIPATTTYAFWSGKNLLSDWGGSELWPCHPLRAIVAATRAWTDQDRIETSLSRLHGRRLGVQSADALEALEEDADATAVIEALQECGPVLGDLHKLGVADDWTVKSVLYALAITRHLTYPGHRGEAMLYRPSETGDFSDSLQEGEFARLTIASPASTMTPLPGRASNLPPLHAPPERPRKSGPSGSGGSLPPVFGGASRPTSQPEPGLSDDRNSSISLASVRAAAKPSKTHGSGDFELDLPRGKGMSSGSSDSPGSSSAPPGTGVEKPTLAEFQLAEAALGRGELQQAEDFARRAVDLDPSEPDYCGLLAWISALRDPKEIHKSIHELDRVLMSHPACSSALLYRARLRRRNGNHDGALADFQRLLDGNPTHREAMLESRALRNKLGKR